MRISFKKHVSAEVVPGEGTYVVSERGITAFDDERVAVVAPLLNGTRDFRALVADVSGRCSPGDVAVAIGRLHAADLLAPPGLPPAEGRAPAADAYWELAGAPGPDPTATLEVRAVGTADARALARACSAAGLTVVPPGTAGAGLTLVVCTDYLDPGLGEIDAWHRREGRPWLPAKPHGTSPWVGPVFRPEGACWQCLAHRLAGHRGAAVHLSHVLGRTVPHPPAETSASLGLGRQLAVTECEKWLAGHRYAGQDGVQTLDTLTLITRLHPLTARPQCPGCGDPELVTRRVRQPVILRSRRKAELTGSGHRAVPAHETLRSYGHLISPVTGVVKEVRRDDRGPAEFHSFRSGRNHAAAPRGLTDAASRLRSESGGKGMTETDARVSALCEALERHSGTYQGDEPTVRASWREVADRAVHPDACQLYDPRQHTEPFDDEARVDWTPVWSLTRRAARLLPTALLYYDAPRTPGLGRVRADSNGNAGGSSLEDAVVQGFLELVERDAVALWWYNRTRHPAVDLDSFTQPWIRQVRELHASLHREVWVLDVTADFPVPTFAAVTRRTDKPAEDILFGFGAHFDPTVALCRALAEMNQMMPAVADVDRSGGYGTADTRLRHWWSDATLAGHPYLAPADHVPARTRGDFAYTPRADLLDDVTAIEEAVRDKGMELLVLDQTRPDIKLPVVKVIVPGMRHFWSRLAPGRLFDVPVQLGTVAEPTPYECLNPTAMFL